VEWNDSASVATTARYNLTGLKPNTGYAILKDSSSLYALDTDSQGNLPSFTVDLSQNVEHNIRIEEVGYLEVSLVLPTPGAELIVDQNSSFSVNATVYCREGSCGDVNGTVRYNLTSPNPDTPVNETVDDKPFYTSTPPAMKACPTNPLDKGEFCNLTWTVFATGDFISYWKIGVLFNSTFTNVEDNHTSNATIKIIECHEDVSIGWNSIDFGTLNPNTLGSNNPAPGNVNKLYNITNLGTCNETLWIKGTDLENVTLPYPNVIGVGNLTWSNTTNNYASSYPTTYVYALLNLNFTKTKILTTYYWLAVPPVYAGKYNGTLTIKWNTTQQTG
jgi:hypothetical protein